MIFSLYIVMSAFSSVKRDKHFNNTSNSIRQKVPRVRNLRQRGGTRGSAGREGEIILNRNNKTYYGHTGQKWVPFNGGTSGGGTIVTLDDACIAPNHESLVASGGGVGPNLAVKGLVEGTNITLTESADCITITADGGDDQNLFSVLNEGNDANGKSIEDTMGPLKLQVVTGNNGTRIGNDMNSGQIDMRTTANGQTSILLVGTTGGTTIYHTSTDYATLLLNNNTGGVHLVTQQPAAPTIEVPDQGQDVPPAILSFRDKFFVFGSTDIAGNFSFTADIPPGWSASIGQATISFRQPYFNPPFIICNPVNIESQILTITATVNDFIITFPVSANLSGNTISVDYSFTYHVIGGT